MDRNHKIAVIGGIVVTVGVVAFLANKGIFGQKTQNVVSKIPGLNQIKTQQKAPAPVVTGNGPNNTVPNNPPGTAPSSSFLIVNNQVDIVDITKAVPAGAKPIVPDLIGYGTLIQLPQ